MNLLKNSFILGLFYFFIAPTHSFFTDDEIEDHRNEMFNGATGQQQQQQGVSMFLRWKNDCTGNDFACKDSTNQDEEHLFLRSNINGDPIKIIKSGAKCIPASFVCNGNFDCPNGEDEEFCGGPGGGGSGGTRPVGFGEQKSLGLPIVRKGYGESCNKTTKCNHRAWLSCHSEICSCTKPDEMMYNPLTKRCVARSGDRCRYGGDDDDPSTWFEKIDCIDNALCDLSTGYCRCSPFHFETSNGTCQEKRAYGEGCDSSNECRDNLFMSCIGGICQCDERDSVLADIERDSSYRFAGQNDFQCVGLPGSPCKKGKCGENAFCNFNVASEGFGFCQCILGFTESKDKSCDRDFGERCDGDKPCSDVQFACINSICNCKYPNHQIYVPERRQCISKVAGPCENNFTCVLNAICSQKLHYKECECRPGFVEDNDGFCNLGYGESCSGRDFINCDPVAPLHCRNGNCGCFDDLEVYNEDYKKCFGGVGSRCYRDQECVEFGQCALIKGRPSLAGRCRCIEGYVETSKRTCKKK